MTNRPRGRDCRVYTLTGVRAPEAERAGHEQLRHEAAPSLGIQMSSTVILQMLPILAEAEFQQRSCTRCPVPSTLCHCYRNRVEQRLSSDLTAFSAGGSQLQLLSAVDGTSAKCEISVKRRKNLNTRPVEAFLASERMRKTN